MPEDVIAGHRTHWRVMGRGPRPALLLHCSLAHGGALTALGERLGDLMTCTAPDFPGHGRSADWDGTGCLHGLATAIAAALAERIGGGAPVDLIGHSFGASVALRLGIERPDLVRSLTLNEPVFFAAAKAGDPAVAAAFDMDQAPFYETLARGRKDEAAAMFHGVWGTGPALADLPAPQRAYIVDRIGLIPAMDAVLRDDSAGLLAPGRMEAMAMPVLLVEGALSPPVIGAINAELARRIPGARRLVVPGAAHMLPITHPEAVAPAIRGLLARAAAA